MNNSCQDSQTKAAKQPSVLENEIDSLRSEVIRINRLADSISDLLRSPQPCCTKDSSKPDTKTIAGELNGILTIAEEARVQLESIGELIESQLGDLKLEYINCNIPTF